MEGYTIFLDQKTQNWVVDSSQTVVTISKKVQSNLLLCVSHTWLGGKAKRDFPNNKDKSTKLHVDFSQDSVIKSP